MATSRCLALCALAVTLASCVSYHQPRRVDVFDSGGSSGVELATVEREDGWQTTYSLMDGSLHVRKERQTEVPSLGLSVREVDGAEASRLSVEPYTGLIVSAVDADSPAHRAGVRAGDLLRRIDDEKLSYASQYDHVVSMLDIGRRVELAVRRGTETPREHAFAAEVGTRSKRDVERAHVPLKTRKVTGRPLLGTQLIGLPLEWNREIFGENRELVIVRGVEVGSPAYFAGLRGGDVIERIGGEVPVSLKDVEQEIEYHGTSELPMSVEVRRLDGEVFVTRVEPEDYSGSSRAWIPLVMSAGSDPATTRWSVGPFGSLIKYRSEYLRTGESREVESSTSFEMLFGLISVRSSPTQSRTRLLWLFHF